MVVQVCGGTIRCACTAPRDLLWASRRASCGRFQCKLRPDGTFCCHERSKLQVGTYGQPQSHLGLYLRYPASCGCHHSPALCLYIARYAAGRRSHKMIDLARTVTRGAVWPYKFGCSMSSGYCVKLAGFSSSARVLRRSKPVRRLPYLCSLQQG